MRKHSERGQSLVEFVIATSVTLLLIFTMVDFGRAIYEYNLVAQAARVGARYAIVNTPASTDTPAPDCGTAGGTCQTNIYNYLAAHTGLDTGHVKSWSITFGPGSSCSSSPSTTCWVNVSLVYNFHWLALPLGTKTFTASSQMWLSSQY